MDSISSDSASSFSGSTGGRPAAIVGKSADMKISGNNLASMGAMALRRALQEGTVSRMGTFRDGSEALPMMNTMSSGTLRVIASLSLCLVLGLARAQENEPQYA